MESELDTLQMISKYSDMIRCIKSNPQDKRSVSNQIGVSSKSVYRWGKELIERDIVRKDGSRYKLTCIGKAHLELYEDYKEVSNKIRDVLPEEGQLSELPLEYWCLRDAEINVTEEVAPQSPMNTLEESFNVGENVKAAVPVVSPFLVNIFHRFTTEMNGSVDLILPEETAEHMLETYETKVKDMTNSGFSLKISDDRFRYGIVILEDMQTAILFIYHNGNIYSSIKTNSTPSYCELERDYNDIISDIGCDDSDIMPLDKYPSHS